MVATLGVCHSDSVILNTDGEEREDVNGGVAQCRSACDGVVATSCAGLLDENLGERAKGGSMRTHLPAVYASVYILVGIAVLGAVIPQVLAGAYDEVRSCPFFASDVA